MAESDKTPGDESTPAAHTVIEAFGGIRPMAQKLGVAASTVQGWKERGVIPPARHKKILEVAKAEGFDLSSETVAASAQMPEDPTELAAGSASNEAAPEEQAAEEALSQESESADDGDIETPAAPSHAQQSTWHGPFLLGGLVLLIGVGLAVVTLDVWGPLLRADSGSSGKVAELESRVSGLEKRPASDARVDELQQQVAGLQGQLAAARSKADEALALSSGGEAQAAVEALDRRISAALAERGADLDQIDARLERVESHQVVRPVSASDLALTLSIGTLREKIYRGEPFPEELDVALKAAAPRPAVQGELQALRDAADTGVLRIVRLQESFRPTARDIVAAGAGDGEENSLLAGVKRSLSKVVTVRPLAENAEEGSPELAVALAEDALAAGNLGDALDALESLPENAKSVAEPWLTEARRRYDAEQALQSATLAFLADLDAEAAR